MQELEARKLAREKKEAVLEKRIDGVHRRISACPFGLHTRHSDILPSLDLCCIHAHTHIRRIKERERGGEERKKGRKRVCGHACARELFRCS